MIWLAWRQHRKQVLFTGIGLVVLAALMIPTGLSMHNAFDAKGLDDCVRALGTADLVPSNNEACNTAFSQFEDQFGALTTVGVLFLVLPLLVGLFWGAPLVAREVEHGTHRFVWTQGISRRRWALVKFGLVGSVTLIVAVGYGLGMSWWMGPFSQAGTQSRFNYFFFDMQGLVPIGYTLFAVALGVFAGTVWHKVLTAMAVALVGFIGLRIALTTLVRAHYLPAREITYATQGTTVGPNPTRGDWLLSHGVKNASGELVEPNAEIACPPNPQGPGANCGDSIGEGVSNWRLYQPGDRFWLFQGIETGIFVALAALLFYVAIGRIRRIA